MHTYLVVFTGPRVRSQAILRGPSPEQVRLWCEATIADLPHLHITVTVTAHQEATC